MSKVRQDTALLRMERLKGQGRPRFAHGHAYKDISDTLYEAEIRRQYIEQCGDAMRYFEGEVHIELQFSRPLPKKAPQRDDGKPDTSKPDIDNLCKSVLDALSGVAWRDDAQVTVLNAEKAPRRKLSGNLILINITYWKEDEDA